jgi:hypothetical protein
MVAFQGRRAAGKLPVDGLGRPSYCIPRECYYSYCGSVEGGGNHVPNIDQMSHSCLNQELGQRRATFGTRPSGLRL